MNKAFLATSALILLTAGLTVSFVWHTELYMNGASTLTNGWWSLPAIKMYHALMYLMFFGNAMTYTLLLHHAASTKP